LEVEQVTRALDGKLNVKVKLGTGNLTVKELSEIGVARCSLGPGLQFPATELLAKVADNYLKG
jgi:2-methylisocitrate lyase-like PEP mutase family enzyme